MSREMRDSGVEWIGQIPIDWEMAPLGKVASIITGNTPSMQGDEDFYKDGELLWVKPDNLAQFSPITDTKEKLNHIGKTKARIVPPYTPLVCCIGSIGKIGYSEGEVSFNQQINAVVFDNKRVNPKYGLYYISSQEEQHWFYSSGNVLQILNSRNHKRIVMSYPSTFEQDKIVDFLDKRVHFINSLIEKTKSTIEDYKLLKQSIITEAVTKGLDKNVEMKDSGIEWIGVVPSHWNVTKLRYLGTLQNGISKSSEFFGRGTPFVSYSDVYRNYELPKNVMGLVKATENDRVAYSVMKGDVFFTRTSETIEEIGFSSACLNTIPNATFAGFLIRFRPSADRLYDKFSKYYFRSDIHRRYFVKEMNIVTRASLSQGLLRNLSVLLPPIEEQKLIAEYLERECYEIDSLINSKSKIIEELEKYKKSLIYEYVTGKKEVL